MRERTLLPLSMLAIGAISQSAAWSGLASLMGLLLAQEGRSLSQVGDQFVTLMMVGALGTCLAAGLALLWRPRVIATIGAAIATTGTLWLFCSTSTLAPLLLVALGNGVFRPCPWVALATLLTNDEDRRLLAVSTRHWARITSSFLFLSGLVAFASSLGALLTSFAHSHATPSDPRVAYFPALALFGIATVACALSCIEPRQAKPAPSTDVGTYRTPAADTEPEPEPPPLLSDNPGYAPALTIVAIVMTFALSAQWMDFSVLHLAESKWIGATHVFSVVGTLAFGVAVIALPKRWSPLFFAALALLASASGELVLACFDVDRSLPLAVLGSSLSTLGNTVLGALTLLYFAMATHSRARVAVMGAWLCVSSGVFSITGALTNIAVGTPIVGLIGAGLGGIGISTLLWGESWHRRYFRPVEGVAIDSMDARARVRKKRRRLAGMT